MIRRFINWFKGSHARRGDNILKTFTQANVDLQELNLDIVKEQSINSNKIEKLQAKNDVLAKAFTRNSKVANNISKLLGED